MPSTFAYHPIFVFCVHSLKLRPSKLAHYIYLPGFIFEMPRANILLINGVKLHLKCKLSNQRSILLILSTVNFSAIKSKHYWYLGCLIYEIFFRYRRSFDSEYSAPLVAYYIWPALMDGATVVAKGEAFTKRGAVSSCANTIISYLLVQSYIYQIIKLYNFY